MHHLPIVFFLSFLVPYHTHISRKSLANPSLQKMSAKKRPPLPFEWEVVSSENPNLPVLRTYYKNIIERYFVANQVEDLALWEAHCCNPDPDCNYKWSCLISALAKDKMEEVTGAALTEEERADEETLTVVAGGAAVELYFESRCALLAFIGIDERFRGKGLFQEMMGRCTGVLSTMCSTMRLPPFQAFFLECMQAADEDEEARLSSGTDAVARQKMYQKVGFEPVEGVDLVHPGKLKGHKYNLAVFVGNWPYGAIPAAPAKDGEIGVTPASTKLIPLEVVLSFIRDLFRGILAAEDSDSEEEYLVYERVLTQAAGPREALGVGPEFWK